MTDLRKTAEIALRQLQKDDVYLGHRSKTRADAIEALRQALAEPANSTTDFVEPKASSQTEQKTPLKVLNLTVFTENRLRNGRVYDVETLQAMTSRDILAIPDIGKKALKEVMEALDVYAVNMSQERVDETVKREHKPVAWLWKNQDGHQVLTDDPDYADGTWTPLYTAPPKKEWVGLTDEDVHDAFNYVEMVKLLDFDRDRPEWCEAFARACEATLRHRNGEKQ